MSIQVKLLDNSIHKLAVDFVYLSSIFKVDEIAILKISVLNFEKVKEFGDYYCSLDAQERKLFNEPEKIWDKETKISKFLDKYLEISSQMLIELINEVSNIEMNILLNILVFRLSRIIKDKKIEEIRELLKVEDDFTADEKKQLEEETKWV